MNSKLGAGEILLNLRAHHLEKIVLRKITSYRILYTGCLLWFKYCIMQMVRGGKVSSRLHDLVIRGKTSAIVQQFETPYNKKEKYSLESFAIGG